MAGLPNCKPTTSQSHNLFSFIDHVLSINSISQLSQLLTKRVREALPHQMTAFGIIDLRSHTLIRCHNVDFPVSYVHSVVAEDNRLRSPLFERWARVQSPQIIGTAGSAAEQPTQWREAFKQHGIGSLIGHGIMGFDRGLASFFAFGSSPSARQFTTCDGEVLQIIVPHLHTALIKLHTAGGGERSPLAGLSTRENEVLKWMLAGKSNDEIGMILHISSGTVRNHVHNILVKLRASNRAHAVAIALQQGFITL